MEVMQSRVKCSDIFCHDVKVAALRGVSKRGRVNVEKLLGIALD